MTTVTVNVPSGEAPARSMSDKDDGSVKAGLSVEMPNGDHMCVLWACCCAKTSIYYKFPECIGCTRVGECCCFKAADQCRIQKSHLACLYQNVNCFCCDMTMNFQKDGCCSCSNQCIHNCCFECKGAYKCKIPQTCIKGGFQICCIDERYSCPCDEDVPFQIGCEKRDPPSCCGIS